MSQHHARLNQRKWARARRRALDRDGWRCECGKIAREVHHVRALFGSTETNTRTGEAYRLAGLKSMCVSCHLAAHNKTPGKIAAQRAEWEAHIKEKYT